MAWAAARVFLALNEIPLRNVDVDKAEALVMSVARGELVDVTQIADGLRSLYLDTA